MTNLSEVDAVITAIPKMNLTISYSNDTGPSMMYCDMSSAVTFQYYTWGVVANIIAVYGIIGNILSIVVLRHRMMQNSTSYYLISLAVYDIVVLLSMSLFLALPTIYLEKKQLEGYYYAYRYMHPFCYPLALLAQTATIYTVVGFTIERFIAVCRPLQAAHTCTTARTKMIICLIFACSVVYNMPRFLETKTEEVWDQENNRTIPVIQYTEVGQNEVFKQVYFIYLNLIVMFGIPFSLLSVLNVMLIRAVRKAHQERSRMSQSVSKEANLTVMLIAVIIVFLVCQLPSIADNILWTIFDASVLQCSIHYTRFTTISNLMVVVNSAVNFILYCLFGKRFRRTFVKIFNPWKKKELRFNKFIMYDSTMVNSSQRRQVTRVYDSDTTLV